MATNVYIDGFNLYYGSLKGYPRLRWLNLSEMCRRLLPDREINRVRYFTSLVDPRPHNPDELYRQNVYLRALKTVPNLTIHLGRFVTRPARLPRDPLTYLPEQDGPETLAVLRTEEKRTDVNIATHLLVDCFDDDFDEAVIVSNDSDLTLPVEVVIGKFGKPVGMVNPHPRSRLSRALTKATTFQIRTINRSVLARSQFPEVLSDDRGEFRRPSRWR